MGESIILAWPTRIFLTTQQNTQNEWAPPDQQEYLNGFQSYFHRYISSIQDQYGGEGFNTTADKIA